MPRAADKQTLSQISDGSDDSGLMAAVAKQVQSTLQKKRKDHEEKFLMVAKAELAKGAAAEIEEYEDALNELKTTFDSFVMQYAAAEDSIRVLWEQLLTAHQKFSEFTAKKRAAIAESETAREAGQVKGMALSKKAVEDFSRLISALDSGMC